MEERQLCDKLIAVPEKPGAAAEGMRPEIGGIRKNAANSRRPKGSQIMKSAFELAMEKFGGDEPQGSPLTDEQKRQLAEVDRKYEAKIAHAKLTAREKKPFLESREEEQQLDRDLALEIQTCQEQRERAKEELRRQFKA